MSKSIVRLLVLILCLPLFTACSAKEQEPLLISAIPDQYPAVLEELYTNVANYLEQELGIPVEYQAEATYDSVVSAFSLGQLDLVWFGGLTGVQARLRVEGAQAIVQRDIDATFQSVFIANANAGLEPFDSVDGLAELAGHSFTFGSKSSTSGYLMPLYFLGQANIDADANFDGPPFFSGSHD